MPHRPDKSFFPGQDDAGVPPSTEEPAADGTRLVGQEGPGGLPRIYVARAVLEFVQACARRAGQEGAAGFLMGRALKNPQGRRFVLIDGCLEAPEVEAAARSVKLTPMAWKSLRAAASEAFRHREVIGWFHARPGEPLHLSPYETFVQQTHFGAPWQVALVYDPASGAMAWWGWDGEALERASGFRIWEAPASGLLAASDLQRLGFFAPPAPGPVAAASEGAAGTWERGTWPVSRAAQVALERRRRASQRQLARSPWLRVARVLQGVTVLVLVFVAAMLARWGLEQLWPQLAGRPTTAPGSGAQPPPGPMAAPGTATAPAGAESSEVMGGGPATPALPQLPPRPGEGASASNPAGSPASPPTRAGAGSEGPPASAGGAPGLQSYRVQPGDTLWLIARRFYGDPSLYRWLADANGIADPHRLMVGQELVLPPRDGAPPRRK